jgi:hypothetical protein
MNTLKVSEKILTPRAKKSGSNFYEIVPDF